MQETDKSSSPPSLYSQHFQWERVPASLADQFKRISSSSSFASVFVDIPFHPPLHSINGQHLFNIVRSEWPRDGTRQTRPSAADPRGYFSHHGPIQSYKRSIKNRSFKRCFVYSFFFLLLLFVGIDICQRMFQFYRESICADTVRTCSKKSGNERFVSKTA